MTQAYPIKPEGESPIKPKKFDKPTLEAAKRILSRGRAQMIDVHPYFGMMAMNLKLCPREGAKRLHVTERLEMFYNPEYILSLHEYRALCPDDYTRVQVRDLAQEAFIHMTLHLELEHPLRRRGRNTTAWSFASCIAVACMMEHKMKVHVGEDWPHCDRTYCGTSVEEIYNDIKGDDPSQWPSLDPETTDWDLLTYDQKKLDDLEEKLKDISLQSYFYAKGRGNLPLGIEERIGKLSRPKVDWKAFLWQFASSMGDYEYRLPGKARHLAVNLSIAKRHVAPKKRLIIAVDTSGSVWDVKDEFFSEVFHIANSGLPVIVRLMMADAEVQFDREFDVGEFDPSNINTKGAGGTSFVPVFEKAKDAEADALIYLTDLEGEFPTEEPPFPVLWVAVEGSEYMEEQIPFGQVIYIPVRDQEE